MSQKTSLSREFAKISSNKNLNEKRVTRSQARNPQKRNENNNNNNNDTDSINTKKSKQKEEETSLKKEENIVSKTKNKNTKTTKNQTKKKKDSLLENNNNILISESKKLSPTKKIKFEQTEDITLLDATSEDELPKQKQTTQNQKKQIIDIQKPVQLENKKTDIESKNTDIENKKTNIENKKTDIESKNTDIENKKTNIESKKTDIESKNTDIENKKTDIESKNTDIDNLSKTTNTDSDSDSDLTNHSCPHLLKFENSNFEKISFKILDPSNWNCHQCLTTASVWACLTCGIMCCGRYFNGHAREHFAETGHELVLEVNSRLCHCYQCNNWVGNDTPTGKIQLLRRLIEKSIYHDFESDDENSKRYEKNAEHFEKLDRMHNVINRWKLFILTKSFNKWKEVLIKPEIITPKKLHRDQESKIQNLIKNEETLQSLNKNLNNNNVNNENKEILKTKQTREKTKNTFKVRHCGLRNLGNTCFMNSILQALVTVPQLREYFTKIFLPIPKKDETIFMTLNERTFTRRDTMFCFANLSERHKKIPELNDISVCNQLHELFRVLWSGKWSVVTPFSLQESVWKFFPLFKNRQQQDAQEFLIHLLERIHQEIAGPLPKGESDNRLSIITQVFQGKLTSYIRCLECNQITKSFETFTDLQLDIPNISLAKYRNKETAQNTLEECLDKFIKSETLGEKIRNCENCKSKQDAETRLILSKLPQNLIIVLKRFYWNQTSRAKINTQVKFPLELDFSKWTETNESQTYGLQSVIVHHGLSPISGHYTCFSLIEDEWILFNDAKTKICTPEEVLKSEACLLFYQRKKSPFLED